MNRERFQRVEALFERVLGISDPKTREAYLEETCATDPEVGSQVRELLGSYDSWTAGLALPAPVLPRCGAYECQELLGAGGMGAVYRGRRVDGQYQQDVAVKFLRGSLRSDAYHARFRAERQILANLNHPHIARLLDGGMTPDGEPYLVMEFVDGEPLDTWCDRRKLPVEARLALFRQVLDAVDYAHRNLVVHQDLKPSNILVNRDGAVKLVDFGTSRLLAEDATVTIAAGALTPAYASPEQLRGEPPATTNDVFSLGVVLFMLLTGANPFGAVTSYAGGLDRALRETDPARPDLSLTEEAAQARSSTVTHLRKRLTGDLASILRKALAHHAAQRYPSVANLAEDLTRYDDRRPVLARRQDWRYIAGRALRRHARSVAAAALLIAGLSGAALFSAREARRAQREADRALAANRFLTEIFQIPVRDTATRSGLTVHELLDLAQQRVPPLLGADPLVAADVDYVLADGFLWVGDAEKSRALLGRALDRARQAGDIPRQAAAIARLGGLSYLGNHFDAAWKESLEALDLWKRHQAEFAPRQAVDLLSDAGTNLLYIRPFDIAHRPYLQTALDLARRYPKQVPSSSLAACLQKLGESYINVDRRYAEAHKLLAEAVAILRVDPTRGDLLVQSLQSLGRANRFLGDYAGDEQAQREAFEQCIRMAGPASAGTISQHSIWAQSLLGAGRVEEAYRESTQALADMRLHMPTRGSPLLWTSLSSAATAACLSRRFAECGQLAREAIQTLGAQPNPGDLRLTDAEALLGMSLAAQGRRAEADPYIDRALRKNSSLNRRPVYSAALEALR